MPTRKVNGVTYYVMRAKTRAEGLKHLLSVSYFCDELSGYNKELGMYEYLFYAK